MKNLSLLTLIIFVLTCCSGPGSIPKTDTNNQQSEHNVLQSELDTFYFGDLLVHVKKIKESDFRKVITLKEIKTKKETYYLEKDSGLVRRGSDTLFFKTENKILGLINNKADDDTYVNYSYLGYLKEIDQFLVCGQFYEWFNYFLVDRVTGDTTVTCSPPLLSPDGTRFISWNSDLEAGFNFNGLALFTNTHRPKLLGLRTLVKWGPEKIKWLDNSTLVMEATVWDTTKKDFFRTDYFKIDLTGK